MIERISGNDPGNNLDPQLSLKDLIDIKDWQRIQDSFYAITDIGLRTLDAAGVDITTPSGIPKLCTEVINKSYLKKENCLPTFLGGKAVVDRNLSFVCPPGLNNFIAPLKYEKDKVIGYVILGPVILVSRKPREIYYKIAEELNTEPEAFWNGILEIRVMSFFRIQTIVGLIQDIGTYVIKLAYENLRCKDETKKCRKAGMPGLAAFLDKFLNVALQVSGADIGSIMMLDKDKKELTICASRGLSDDVVKKARVKLGEGISGIAVKENKAFLIDSTQEDNRIKKYLRRPQVKSSMVLPIKIKDAPSGVMNLGITETTQLKFNKDNVSSINELIELASFALYTPEL
jgi:ligand-binding sensor protein/putative methionine-R-sulfoxide reductase with GAF domain